VSAPFGLPYSHLVGQGKYLRHFHLLKQFSSKSPQVRPVYINLFEITGLVWIWFWSKWSRR